MNPSEYYRIGRRLALALLAVAPIFAQCPTGTLYPGALDTNTSLTVAKNNLTTTLSVQQQVTDTVAIVASTTGFAANMMLAVDTGTATEYEYVSSVVGMNTLNVTRACESTSAVVHLAGAAVTNTISAYSGHTGITGAVVAIETALGANLANVPGTSGGTVVPINKGGTGQTTQTAALNAILGSSGVTGVQGSGDTKVQLAGVNSGTLGAPLCNDANSGATTTGCNSLPAGSQLQYLRIQPNTGNNTTTQFANLPVLNAQDYNFPSQSPGTSLIVGNTSITMAPVPQGVNGNDSFHRLYVSGGTGTAEACLITGGAGTQGQASGAIIINCANTHSGAYTIQSIDGGLQEAAQAAVTLGGAVVYAPAGTYTAFAALNLQSGIVLNGVIGQTIIKPANSTLARNPQWQNPNSGAAGYYCVICVVTGSSNVVVRDLVVDENGPNQTYSYIPGDIMAYNNTNVKFENVTVQNRVAGGTGVAIGVYGQPLASSVNVAILYANVDAHPGGCTVPNGGGAYYIQGEATRIVSSFAKDTCDVAYVVTGCDHCVVADSVSDIGAGQMSLPSFGVEGATYTEFNGDQCIATGTNGGRYCVGVDSNATTGQTVGTKIIGVSASHISNVVSVGAISNVSTVIDTDIIGIHGDNIALDCIDIFNFANKVTIIGGDLEACGGSGITIQSTGSGVGTTVQNVIIDGIKIDHAVGSAIVVNNSSTGPPVQGLRITNSQLIDSNGTPRTVHGINIGAGVVSDFYMAGNSTLGVTGGAYLFSNTWSTSSAAVIGPNITGDSSSMITSSVIGAAVASAATITPTGAIFHVTGTTTISTINPVGAGATSAGAGTCITIIPDGIFATNTAGNIALASTSVVGKLLIMCNDSGTTKWYPSY